MRRLPSYYCFDEFSIKTVLMTSVLASDECGEICAGCLSRGRRLQLLTGATRTYFDDIVRGAGGCAADAVCWECAGALRGWHRFRARVSAATRTLAQYRFSRPMHLPSLSHLSCFTTDITLSLSHGSSPAVSEHQSEQRPLFIKVEVAAPPDEGDFLDEQFGFQGDADDDVKPVLASDHLQCDSVPVTPRARSKRQREREDEFNPSDEEPLTLKRSERVHVKRERQKKGKQEIEETARKVVEDLLPLKSKSKYLKTYEHFIQWKREKGSKSLAEQVFLAYFWELAKKMKPTTLWVVFSMLKSTVLKKHGVHLEDYHNLMSMLKRQSTGYKAPQSKVFTLEDVQRFLTEAPDSEYLDVKVILIFGVLGACRSVELTNVALSDVELQGDVILVSVRGGGGGAGGDVARTFIVREQLAELVRTYMAARPPRVNTKRFFLSYRKNKCTKQVIGRHKIAALPKVIASFLNLPNPEGYTGHCYRRSSATILADVTAGASHRDKEHSQPDRVTEMDAEQSVEGTGKINGICGSDFGTSTSEDVRGSHSSILHERLMRGVWNKKQDEDEGTERDDNDERERDDNEETERDDNNETAIKVQQTTTSVELSQVNITPGNSTICFKNCTFSNCSFK